MQTQSFGPILRVQRLGTNEILKMKKTITNIQIESKHSSRRTLFLDGECFSSVDASLITQFGLRIGLEIEEDALQKLIQEDEVAKAKSYAFDLLLSQNYSKRQMNDKLKRKGYSQHAIDATLERLEQLGYIKDEVYAHDWVDSHRRSRPRGKKLLKHELMNKGIDKTTVDRVLSEIDDAEEASLALGAAQKQAARYKSLPPDVAKRRLYSFLLRRGFDYETIQRTVEQVLK